MKRNRFIIVLLTVLVLVVCLWGCDLPDEDTTGRQLNIGYDYWNDMGSGDEGLKKHTDLRRREIVYEDSFGTFRVYSANSKRITLEIKEGAFVEKDGDGINLNAEPLKRITIEKGESVTVASQTMDAGVKLTFRYL
uniref:hypothetical protein n=1 Tax=Eubacterium cellulosolvens TaxID=29322 RepID=UPI000487E7E7|nr:hypothetical protein [[Eubacterium] cellulosolvens]